MVSLFIPLSFWIKNQYQSLLIPNLEVLQTWPDEEGFLIAHCVIRYESEYTSESKIRLRKNVK